MRLSVLSFFALPFMSALGEQVPMNSDYTPLTTTKPLLNDLLTIESSASIFYSYARELELSKMLEDENARLTVLVPTNKAVMALARKPCVRGSFKCGQLMLTLYADTKDRRPLTRELRSRRNSSTRSPRRTLRDGSLHILSRYLWLFLRDLCSC